MIRDIELRRCDQRYRIEGDVIRDIRELKDDVIRDIELGRCDQRYRTEAYGIRDIELKAM